MKTILIFLLFPCFLYSQISFTSAEIGGGSLDDFARKVVKDTEGNLFVLGTFSGPATFGSENFEGAGFVDCYLQKLNSFGEIIWTKAIGGPNTDASLCLAIDGNNDVWISGKFNGQIDLNPDAGEVILNSDPSNGIDCFLAKYSGITGAYVTHKDISSGGVLEIRSIAFSDNGIILIGGTFQFTVDFDFSASTLNKTSFVNSYDGFVASYSSNFESLNWVNVLSSNNPALDYVNDVKILNNKVYLTGLVAGTMDIDPGISTVQINGATDAFLISYNLNNGSLNWGFKLGGNSLEIGNFISITSNTIYLSGTLNSNNVDFNAGNQTNLLSANGISSPPFIAKYDTNGNYNSAFLLDINTTGTYSISKIVEAESGEVLVSGYFKGIIDIDPSVGITEINSINVNNSFFMWLNENDSLLNHKTISGTFENSIFDLAYNQGSIIAVGGFEGSCAPDQNEDTEINALFPTNNEAFIFIYNPIVTTSQTTKKSEIKLYPNPVNSSSILFYNEDLEFQIISTTGKSAGSIMTNKKSEILEKLDSGIYYLINSNKSLYLKLIK